MWNDGHIGSLGWFIKEWTALRAYPQYQEWHRGVSSPVAHDVVDFSLIVRDACGHQPATVRTLRHCLHRQNLYSKVDKPTTVEQQMLDEEIVCHKGILPKLYFEGHSGFHKVSLLVGLDYILSLT